MVVLTVWPRISYFQGLKRADRMRDHKMRWAAQLVLGLPIEKIVASNFKFVIVGLRNSCKTLHIHGSYCQVLLERLTRSPLEITWRDLDNEQPCSKQAKTRRPWISRTGAERAAMLHSFDFTHTHTHTQTGKWQLACRRQAVTSKPSKLSFESVREGSLCKTSLNVSRNIGCIPPKL